MPFARPSVLCGLAAAAAAGPLKPMTFDTMGCVAVGAKNVPTPFPSEGGCGTKTWPSSVLAGSNAWQPVAVTVRDAASNDTLASLVNIGDDMSGLEFAYKMAGRPQDSPCTAFCGAAGAPQPVPGWATVGGAQITGNAYFSGPTGQGAVLDVYGVIAAPGAPGMPPGQQWPVWAQYAVDTNRTQPAAAPLQCVAVQASANAGPAAGFACGSGAFPDIVKLTGDAGGVRVTHDDEGYVQAVGQSYGLWDSTDGALYDVTWVPRTTSGAAPSPCIIDAGENTTCTITARLDFNGTYLRGMGTYTEQAHGEPAHVVTVVFEYAAANQSGGTGPIKPLTFDELACATVGAKNIPAPFPGDGGCGSKTWPQTVFAGPNGWQSGAVVVRDGATNGTLGWLSNIGDSSGTDFNYNLPSWATVDGAKISGFAYFSGPKAASAALDVYGLVEVPGAGGALAGQQWPVYAQYLADANYTPTPAPPLKCVGVQASSGSFACGSAAFPDVVKVAGDAGGVRVTHADEGYVQAVGQSYGLWDSTDGALYDVTWVPRTTSGAAPSPCAVDSDETTTCIITARLDFNGTWLRGMGTYTEQPKDKAAHVITVFFEYSSGVQPTPPPAPATPAPAPATPAPVPVTPRPVPVTPRPAPVTPAPAPVTPPPAPVTPAPAPVTPAPVRPTPQPPAPVPPPTPPTCAACGDGDVCCDPTASPKQICPSGKECCDCGAAACSCGATSRPARRRASRRARGRVGAGGPLKPMAFDRMSCIAVGSKNIPKPFPSEGGCGTKTWPQTIFAGSNAWQPGAVLMRNEANETLGWISNIGDTSGQDFNYNLPGWATVDGAKISGFSFFSGPTGERAVLNVYGLVEAPGAPGMPPGQQWPVYAQYAVNANRSETEATPLKCRSVRASTFVGGNFSCGIAAFPDVIKVVGDDGGVRITHDDEGFVQAVGQSAGVWDSTDGAAYDVTWVPIQPYGARTRLGQPAAKGPCIVDTDYRTTCSISTRLDFNGTHLRGIGTYMEHPLNKPANAVTLYFEYEAEA